MNKTLLQKVMESEELQSLNPENKNEEDIIYYTCPVNYNLPDNIQCECMPKDWQTHCRECWNRTI